MISRKNDGSVKMTSQRGTSKLHVLGVTTDDGTLDRYLQVLATDPDTAVRNSDAELSFERVTVATSRFALVRMHWNATKDCYFFTETRKNDIRRSFTYGNRTRALQAFRCGEVRWRERAAIHVGGSAAHGGV